MNFKNEILKKVCNEDISELPFFLLWQLGVELLRPVDRTPSSSSLGSFFISGFFSSSVTDTEDEVVSMGSSLHPSPNTFSFLICVKVFVKKEIVKKKIIIKI